MFAYSEPDTMLYNNAHINMHTIMNVYTLSDLNFDQVCINSKTFLALTFTEWNESLTLQFQDLLMESIRDKSGN